MMIRQPAISTPFPSTTLFRSEVRAEKLSWTDELANWPSPNEKGRIGPRQALAALAKAMPKNAMVSTDIGNVCSVSNSYLHLDRKSTRLNSSHLGISYAVFCLK